MQVAAVEQAVMLLLDQVVMAAVEQAAHLAVLGLLAQQIAVAAVVVELMAQTMVATAVQAWSYCVIRAAIH
jgi:hypothetical protein